MNRPDPTDRVRELMPRIQEGPWGLFVDIDGTIAEITAIPDEATVRPECRETLDSLTRQLAAVVVLSGRDLRTAQRMVALETVTYFTNHGIERWEDEAYTVTPEVQPYLERLQEATKRLKERLDMSVYTWEDKGVGLSIHYRTALDPEQARDAALALLDELGISSWMDVREGKMLLDLRLPVSASKGTAVETIIQERGLRGAILMGDDITDMDGFRAARRMEERGAFTSVDVAVLSDGTPDEVMQEAAYHLDGVPAVERFLQWLSKELG